jgi:hypothetical protein
MPSTRTIRIHEAWARENGYRKKVQAPSTKLQAASRKREMQAPSVKHQAFYKFQAK